jgi:type IV fimbrial biogenesis protein FimT
MYFRRKHQGLTILELLIVLAILGILAAVSFPGFMDTLGRMSANTAARSLASALSLARSEAVKAGMDVSLCPSDDGLDCAAGSWNSGWIVFIDANDDADGDTGSIDAGDRVVRVFEPLAGMNLTVSPATDLMRYDSKGYGKNAAILRFTICPLNEDNANARQVEVSLSGRARIVEEGLVC